MNKYMYYCKFWLECVGIFDRHGKWCYVLMAMSLLVNVSAIVAGFAELIHVTDDLQLTAELMSAWLLTFNALARLLCLIINRKKMNYLRTVIETGKVSEGQRSEADDPILEYYDQVGLRFCRVYGSVILLVGVVMLVQPVPGILLGYERKLPFPTRYPFSVNTTIGYSVAYVHLVISSCSVVVHVLAFDTWFIFLNHHACSNFHLLQTWLEEISEVDPRREHEKISRCIQLHQNVNKFAADIEDVFNGSIIQLFLITTVNTCISGYALAKSHNEVRLMVKHFSSIFGLILQALILNWCGQFIEDKSIGVSLAISRSKLYELNDRHQRDLSLIMLVRAQKPTSLSAGKFYSLSLPTFTNIVHASMSYMTVLMSIQE
ncbi:odorant receptor 47a-like isoform X2 [Neodiprion pinetum]|uniref:odorant receptor 47a-like isoform X2 n=1 Tax=Neodiprion pinetum TaxID=441929 RepID=UPI0037166852